VPIDRIREICHKHGAEFVENRRELAAYLQRIDLEPAALVGDSVHQNQHGRIRIWDNICRHIAKPERFNDPPESRERRIVVAPPASSDAGVAVTGSWIDLIGRKTPTGGTARVLIDGVPADQALAFYTTFIQPKPAIWPRALKGPGPGDVAPHAVELRTGVVPQTWTITMTSDTGDYRLTGSVTGPDGEGNVAQAFVSRSGQIGIDPKLWRHARTERKDSPVVYGNGTGDTFTFDVYRTAEDTISFRADAAEPLCQPLVQNLTNGPHTLEIISAGDGDVVIEALYAFEPPIKD